MISYLIWVDILLFIKYIMYTIYIEKRHYTIDCVTIRKSVLNGMLNFVRTYELHLLLHFKLLNFSYSRITIGWLLGRFISQSCHSSALYVRTTCTYLLLFARTLTLAYKTQRFNHSVTSFQSKLLHTEIHPVVLKLADSFSSYMQFIKMFKTVEEKKKKNLY